MTWQAVIGLEIHVQLKTRTKMFCRCANGFGAEPNTTTCPVCLGHPGSLPVPNRTAVEWSVDLLDDLERRDLARLSVFAGSCTYEAAEEICGANPDTLQSLLDKSLLRRR